VQQDLASVGHKAGRVANKVAQAHELSGLMHIVYGELSEIEEKRNQILKQVSEPSVILIPLVDTDLYCSSSCHRAVSRSSSVLRSMPN
jgi:hypothetical protein